MKTALITLIGEVRKSFLITWTYKANQLVTMFTLGIIFVGIGLMMGRGQLVPDELASFFLGFLTWYYALMAIGNLSWGLRGEINAGTLEQMAMSPAPVGLILMGRVISNLILSTIQIAVLGLVLSAVLNIPLPIRWEGIVALALTLIGVFGFGFLVAGATLIFKQLESFANLMQNGLLFLNGSMLPISEMPAWLAGIAKVLPTTQGIIVLRRVVSEGETLAAAWQDGSLPWLAVHSAIYLAAGWTVFLICERIAKQRGSLGQY